MEQKQKSFFCQSIGATLNILQFYPLNQSRRLLMRMSHPTRNFYAQHENNIFKTCLPTQFCSIIKHEQTFKGDSDRFIVRALHLRDSLFVLLYATNEVEIKNIETGVTIQSIQIPMEESPMDMDIYKNNERTVLVGYRSDVCYLVDFKRKSVNQFPHYLPAPLQQVQYLQNFPKKNFITVSKSGVFRMWDENMIPRDIAKFHAQQFLTDYNRPFANLVELENNKDNYLQFKGDCPETMISFILQGKNMCHSAVFFRYFGLNSPDNQLTSINIQGQFIHCLKQIQTKYLAVSTDKELHIYDIMSRNLIRKVITDQPFQFIVSASPIGYQFECGMIAEACIGYSYKTFYECGISIAPSERTLDHQFQLLQELEQQRKSTVYKMEVKPNAIISKCEIQRNGETFIVVTPREEQDTLYIYKVGLM
eukprot:403374336